MPEYLTAIDVGTTGCRTMVFDLNGRVIATAYQEYNSYYPKPTWVEQNAEDWWKAACYTTKKCIYSMKGTVNVKAIKAVSVTNQRESVVPLDSKGRELRSAIIWQDRRSQPECEQIADDIGKRKVFSITGLTIDPYFSASKILWIKHHEPKVFKSTDKFLLVHDYIIHKLTDEYVTDYSNASRTLMFDIKTFKWSEELCNYIGVDESQLPTLCPSGTIVGQVTVAAAKATGLRAGTEVVSGGGDQQCAALGLGVVQPGRVKATTGTGTFVLAPIDKPIFDPEMRLLLSAHVCPNKWVLEASIFTTGAVYRWCRDNFCELEKNKAKQSRKQYKKRGILSAYQLMDKSAATSPPGANGLLVLPHFAGAGAPYWNPLAKGVILGLSLGHTKADVLRAVMESCSFEVRKNLDVMRSLDIRVSELRVAGGGAKSKLWNTIQSDICKVSVINSVVEEATALGAAMLAGIGCGIFKSIDEAVTRMVHMRRVIKPNSAVVSKYDMIYSAYNKLYDVLRASRIYERLDRT